MIEIDGSIGEGGGQILRTASALSVITNKPLHVFKIRKGRKEPGLKTQHLLGLRALAQFSQGRLEGDFLGSKEIKFWPNQNFKRNISINIPTAGSITLLLQTLLLPGLFSQEGLEIRFRGGATDTFFAPTIDYFRLVFLKILQKILPESSKIDIQIKKRGYYPEGGAELEVKIPPLKGKLNSLNLLDRGNLRKISIYSGASELLKERKVAERQIAGVKEILGKLKLPIEEFIEYHKTQCPGSNICLVAEFENTVIGADNLGRIGKKAEEIGKEVALDLINQEKSKACLDKHLADQILPYLALAEGKSQVTVSEITNHCKTNIWVIEKFIKGKFEIKENSISWTGA
ncbi:MAG TPA: RNA 3'-terminal phosphate cyclase [bacterium]|nr:RNA 3'-terminal phosphate cyclase [bacterium]